MENLLQGLFSVLAEVPDNPLAKEWICVQSRGMKHWISLKTAQQFGISANFRFLFLGHLIDRLLDIFIPPAGQIEKHDNKSETFIKNNLELNFDEHDIFWDIIKHIKGNRQEKAFAVLSDYIEDDEKGKKLFQLAGQIAKLFDDYQLYRPDLLMAWQKGAYEQNLSSGFSQNPSAEWQAFLWQKITVETPEVHLPYRAKTFIEGFSKNNIKTNELPVRICLFGISAFPEFFLSIIEKVSELTDIYLFLLSPSNHFFFDLRPERQIEKIALKVSESEQSRDFTPAALYYETGNPLLSSLGTSCQILHASLENFSYQEPFQELFSDPIKESSSMLSVLKSDILNLIHRKHIGDHAPVKADPSDRSLSIHSCHSPMREAQVLKDLLIREFEKDPDLFPHDIIVMMPDIESYAPFIESVFSLEHTLPFSISDRHRRSESEPLEAFLKILALRDSRLEKTMVLDLLLSESIAGKFNISRDDIVNIEQMTENAGILWGADQMHRQAMNFPPFVENTWEFGLNRLFMGMAMPEDYNDLSSCLSGLPDSYGGILPCESFEGPELEVLGKFAVFIRTLFSCLSALSGSKTVADWCQTLRYTVLSLLNRQTETDDIFFLLEQLNNIKEGAEIAEFNDLLSFENIHALIRERLEVSVSRGNFMTGVISFCNIMPMRSIPFKIIALMGMDEHSFPRKGSQPAFDLMQQYPEPGDKNKRQEDRYLFLESLLSAEKQLIITYTGQSMIDNSPVPPSGVVSELKEVVKESFVFPEGSTFYYEHPLHPFNAACFASPCPNSFASIFSYSNDYYHIANNLINDAETAKDFIQEKGVKSTVETLTSLELEELIRFFRHPVKTFFTEGLNLTLTSPEEVQEDRETFTVKGLDHYSLGSLILKTLSSEPDKELYSVLKAAGLLPPGTKGRLEYESLMKEAEPLLKEAEKIASKKKLPVLQGEFILDGLSLKGDIADIREDGLYLISFGRLNGARLLNAWIQHLFLIAAGSADHPNKTIVTGRDPDNKKLFQQIIFTAPDIGANILLEELIKIYQSGLYEAFLFFPESSWQFVKALGLSNFDLSRDSLIKAMKQAKRFWFDGFRNTGERNNRYTQLLTGGRDIFESVQTLSDSGFIDNSLKVHKPIIDTKCFMK